MSKYPTSGKLEVVPLEDDGGSDLLQVVTPWWIDTGVKGWAFQIEDATGRVVSKLEEGGRWWLLPGFTYDGSSGPTVDVVRYDTVPAALHDSGYRAIRRRKLPMAARAPLDAFYASLLAERGMSPYWHPVRPKPWWKFWRLFNPGYKTRHWGLRSFGAFAATPLLRPPYRRKKAA